MSSLLDGKIRMSPLARGGLFLAAFVAFGLGWWPHRTTIEAPAAYSEAEFSAHRAFAIIEDLAQSPHPTGHPASDRVRTRLVELLEALGLEVEEQEALVVGEDGPQERNRPEFATGSYEAARVRNIVARWPGTSPRPGRDAILLSAHHDSRPVSPGAGDDISGVAEVIEVVRALASAAPLERDIVVLFSDAEELGLYGARAFVNDHPLAATVSVAVNLESRGRGGASRMFETSVGNAGLIERLDRATGPIVTDSLSAAIYRALPRDTDLTILTQADIAGYNFAFIRGVAHYHTPLDRPEFLDLATLQQQGEHLLALVRELGNGPLPAKTTEDAVYFPLGPEIVRFSTGTARVLAVIAFILAGIALGVSLKRGVIRPMSALRATFGWLLLAVLAGFAALAAAQFLDALFAADEMRPTRLEARGGRVLIALLILSLLVLCEGWAGLRRSGLSRSELIASGLILWCALAATLEILLPNAGYLGSLPLAGGALVLLGHDRDGARGWKGAALTAAGVLPFLALWPLVLDGIGAAFEAWIAAAIVFIAALHLPLLVPLLGEIIPGWLLRRRLPILATTTVFAFAVVAATLRYDPEHPRAGSIHYSYETATGAAVWGSFDREPGEWVRQFLGDSPSRGSSRLETLEGPKNNRDPVWWYRSAASQVLRAPEVRVIEDEVETVFRIELPEGTARLDLESNSIPLIDVQIRTPDGSWREVAHRLKRLWLHAPPTVVELRLDPDASGPLDLRVTAMRYGTPEPNWPLRPREPDEVESTADRTYVTVRFGG